MILLFMLMPLLIFGCKFANTTINVKSITSQPCQFLELSGCSLQCDGDDNTLTMLNLTNFTIIDTTFIGCDLVRLQSPNKGMIHNLIIIDDDTNNPNTQSSEIEAPILIDFNASQLQINGLFNNMSDSSCILSCDTFTLSGDLQCPAVALHQRQQNLVLNNVNLKSTFMNCLAEPVTNLLGFVKVTPTADDNGSFYYTSQISVNDTLSRSKNVSLITLLYQLVSPLSSSQNYTILILVEGGDLRVASETVIEGSKIGLFSQSMLVDGSIKCEYGCLQNEGPGRGVSFQYTGAICAGSGGSSAGYGGSGIIVSDNGYEPAQQNNDCFLLVEAIKFKARLNPYNGFAAAGPGSGGGEQYGSERFMPHQNTSAGSGGGYMKLEVVSNLELNGVLSSDGKSGYQQLAGDKPKYMYSGGGAGGSISLSASSVNGTGTVSARGGDSDPLGYAGEGGGGMIKITFYNWENESYQKENSERGFKSGQRGFQGLLDVNQGQRDLTKYEHLFNVSAQRFLATSGTIILPGCPEGFQLDNLTCVRCPLGTYSFTLEGECTQCPGMSMNFKQSDLGQCIHQDCTQFKCDPLKFVTSFITSLWGVSAYIFLFIVIVSGYIIRRIYRLKEAHVDLLPFDFESATKHMVITHIITDTLRKNQEFQLVDLMYHAHRIVLQGSNSYNYPWSLPAQPSQEISYIVDVDEWGKFTHRMNKLAEWFVWEQVVLVVLSIAYYPLYWVMVRYLKKRKYKQMKLFVHKTDIKLWKFLSADEQVFIKLKISKSADYTLLYLDIFNYKNSDLKYLFLACPYIIHLSGEGSYVRPFYLCESDPFLSCLYFAINKSFDHDQDDERYRIMENLVAHKKRMENSARMNKFLLKFNRFARTIDYGSSARIFSRSVVDLLAFLKVWNERFFHKLAIRLDLVVLQTASDGIGNQQITILENTDAPKFDLFMRELHKKYNLKQMLDIKFGLFIYDTEMDVNDFDEAFNNQKISFFEQPRDNLIQNIEVEEEDELNINDLKYTSSSIKIGINTSTEQTQSNNKTHKPCQPSRTNQLSPTSKNIRNKIDYPSSYKSPNSSISSATNSCRTESQIKINTQLSCSSWCWSSLMRQCLQFTHYDRYFYLSSSRAMSKS